MDFVSFEIVPATGRVEVFWVWDMFMAVCNNGEHMADLLKVAPEQIGSWRAHVTQALQKVHDADGQPDETTEKGTNKTVLPTGDDDQLADPAGVEVPQNGPIDTRPY